MKQAKSTEADGTREWAVSGEKGAVNLIIYPDKGKDFRQLRSIGIHSPVRIGGFGHDEKQPCDLVGGVCWHADLPGDYLWTASGHGRFESIIWSGLEGVYADRLGK